MHNSEKDAKPHTKRNILKERRKVDSFAELTFVEEINLTP